MELFNEDSRLQRLSQTAKNKNDKQWYKDQCNLLDRKSFSNNSVHRYHPDGRS